MIWLELWRLLTLLLQRWLLLELLKWHLKLLEQLLVTWLLPILLLLVKLLQVWHKLILGLPLHLPEILLLQILRWLQVLQMEWLN